MADRRALIVWGGWDGHEPDKVAAFFELILKEEGFEVEVSNSLESFADADKVLSQSLIVPIYTMSEITGEQRGNVTKAVSEHGIGIAGCHGGMCDAFRVDTEWQFMTGGQWVAHPGNDGITYPVHVVKNPAVSLIEDLPDFDVVSEQYYLHVDPGVKVLATTPFPLPGVEGPHTENPCDMPTVWTKKYGQGRVFYNALGHHCDVLEAPVPREIMRRGFLWAAKGVGTFDRREP